MCEKWVFLRKNSLILFCLLSVFFGAVSVNVYAQVATQNEEKNENNELEKGSETKQTSESIDLSVSEFLDELFRSEEKKQALQARIQTLQDRAKFAEQMNELQTAFVQLQTEFESKRKLSSWNRLKVESYFARLEELLQQKDKIQKSYIDFIQQGEGIEHDINEQKKKLENAYNKYSSNDLVQEQKSSFQKIQSALKDLQQTLKDKQEEVVAFFKEQKKLLEGIEEFQKVFSSEKDRFENSLFAQSLPPFYEHSFLQQFDRDMQSELEFSFAHLFDFSKLQDRSSLRPYAITLVLFFALSLFFLKLRRDYKFPTPPVSLSFVMSVGCAALIVKSPLPLAVLLVWILLPFFLIRLVYSYQFPKAATRFFLVLFVSYSILRILESFDLPLLIYRISFFVLALFIVAFSFFYFRVLRKSEQKSSVRVVLLFIAFLFFLIAALAEFFGYHSIAVFLTHGLIRSIFLLFVLYFFRKVVDRTLSFFLHLPQIKRIRIIYRQRNLILMKVSQFLFVLAIVVAFLMLPAIWQIYPSVLSAARNILSWGFSIGNNKITVAMLLQVLFIFFLSQFLSFFICSILKDEVYPRKQIDRGVGNSINSLVKYLLWTLAIFVVFFTLGLELKQLAIVAGALSVGIGFGLQNIFNNFISGIILLFERPVKVGDLLEVNGQWGEVEKVGLRSTIIRTFSKTQLIIPNSDFITQTVTNLTLTDFDYRVMIPVGIAYGSDTALAQKTLLEIAEAHPRVVDDPKPTVYFAELGESSLNFMLYVWIADVNAKMSVTSDLLFQIDQKFRELKIEIPFPQRDIHIRTKEQNS